MEGNKMNTIEEYEAELFEQASINKFLLDDNKRLRTQLFKVEAEVIKLTEILDKLFEERED